MTVSIWICRNSVSNMLNSRIRTRSRPTSSRRNSRSLPSSWWHRPSQRETLARLTGPSLPPDGLIPKLAGTGRCHGPNPLQADWERAKPPPRTRRSPQPPQSTPWHPFQEACPMPPRPWQTLSPGGEPDLHGPAQPAQPRSRLLREAVPDKAARQHQNGPATEPHSSAGVDAPVKPASGEASLEDDSRSGEEGLHPAEGDLSPQGRSLLERLRGATDEATETAEVEK